MNLPNRFTGPGDIEVGQELWAHARGWWRRALVLKVNRRRVEVAFRLAQGGAIRRQAVRILQLRRNDPDSYRLTVPAPTEAEVAATPVQELRGA